MMNRRIIGIVGVWLASVFFLTPALPAEQSEIKYAKEPAAEEIADRVRGKIKFVREEIAYLQDKYSSQDEKWKKYVREADGVARSFEERLGSRAVADRAALGEMEKQLDSLSRQIPLRLPSGPTGAGSFGAYYTLLKYSLGWDRRWRTGPHADVVVRFDNSGCKFVFWRGTSYVPCWVTENGIWYSNEFCETIDSFSKGSCEPISDKQCRYSHVRIIESNDARAVVHWRYGLTDVEYKLAHEDRATGWNDWADEYYTVYPDAVAVRKIVLWSSRLDMWHEFQEDIVLNQPGTKPEDNIELGAMTLANLKGESKTYFWGEGGAPPFTDRPEDACIETINLRAKHRPFVIVPPDGASITSFGGHAPGSHFNCWDHWPVSQEASSIRVAASFNRPSHSSLSWVVTPAQPANKGWVAYEKTDKSITKLLLHGMTDKTAAELAPLGRSWLHAPRLKLTCDDFTSQGYNQAERAYLLSCRHTGKPSKLELTLEASEERPIVNPAFVVEGWGCGEAAVRINGRPARRGKDLRLGYRRGLESTDLIVWIENDSVKPVQIEVAPADS